MRRSSPDFPKLIRTVAESGADVVLIGGLAMIVRGCEVTTVDVDFAVARNRDNDRRLVEALAHLHPVPEGWPAELPFVWDETIVGWTTILVLSTDIGSIDFLKEVAGVSAYEGLKERADEVSLYGQTVKVASLDDLIAMKRAADRPKDRLHLLELEALRRLIEEEGD